MVSASPHSGSQVSNLRLRRNAWEDEVKSRTLEEFRGVGVRTKFKI